MVSYRLNVKILYENIFMRNFDSENVIQAFEKSWIKQRPDLNPGSVSLDMRLQLAARKFFDTSNLALKDFDLEWWEYDVLSALRRAGSPYESPVNSLNDILPLTSGALTNRINQLLARQLVTRRNDSKDRRRVLVRLSSTGKKLVDAAATARFEAANNTASALNGNEQLQLNRLLDKLIADEIALSDN